MHDVICIAGTIPELVKLNPVLTQLRSSGYQNTCLYITGQHSTDHFDVDDRIKVHHAGTKRLPGQGDFEWLYSSAKELANFIVRHHYSLCVVHGDTFSTLIGAIAAGVARVRLVHVEAGLRSGNLLSPFPEELIRTIVDGMADLNCCPTEADVSNARRNPTFLSIRTGNTIVDALDRAAPASEVNDNNYILLSLHRREMYYECGSDFLSRVAEVLILNSDLELLILSRNPNQTSDFMDRFKGQHRVRVVPPLPHAAMLGLTQNARCVVTDSGGLLEEATLLGRPVIVIRESVEGSRIKYADRVHPASAEQDLPTALQKALTLLGPSSARYESSETALLARIEWGDGNAARQIVDAIGMIKARGPDAE